MDTLFQCNHMIIHSHRKAFAVHKGTKHESRRLELPKNLINPRRSKLPPYFYPPVLKEVVEDEEPSNNSRYVDQDVENRYEEDVDGESIWSSDEIEAISSLFQGRIPQKPGKLNRERPLPIPIPHKIRPLGLPTPKKLNRVQPALSNRRSISSKVYKNPSFLIGLAREIRALSPEEKVSSVLVPWGCYLRKGSLSLTIRELGHMGLPDRALHVFCWAQKQSHLFPDDRILASTVEVLAKAHKLKMPFDLVKFISLASQSVYESMLKGFIKGGNLGLALKLLSVPTEEELAERDDIKLTHQDCTTIMKVCTKMGKFSTVESLFDWFKKSGNLPNIVMYTTMIHCLYSQSKNREAMALVWEMEASNVLFDLPAFRTVIKLFIALNDFSRTSRYFSKLKESGLSLTFDVYRDLIRYYLASGRLAKCREICHEAEMAGFKLDKETMTLLHQNLAS